MATVLEEGFVSDGYEAQVCLVDGRMRRFHWLSKPVDVAQAANDAETNLKCAEISGYRLYHYPEEPNKWLR